MPGPGGGFEDVGLRATIANVGGFEAAERRVNAGFARLGAQSAKTATQMKVAAGQTAASAAAMAKSLSRSAEQAFAGWLIPGQFTTTFKNFAQPIVDSAKSMGDSVVVASERSSKAINRVAGHASTMGNRSARGFNQTSKGMMQMADTANHAEGAFFRMLKPLTAIGFAVFSIQFLAAAFGTLGSAVFGASSKWEQFQISFSTFLRSAELGRQKLEELATFAERTPFTLPDIVEASKQLLAYGFAGSQLIPMMEKIGDAAAGLGREAFPVIVRALGQMQAATKVNARDMLQLTEAGIPAWRLLADAMQVSQAQVMKLVEKGVVPAAHAIPVLLEGIEKRFGGLGEAQSKSLLGMISNIQDFVFNAQVILQKPIFDRITAQLLKFVTKLQAPEVKATLRVWAANFERVLVAAERGFGKIGPLIEAGLGAVGKAAAVGQEPLKNLANILGLDMTRAFQIAIPLATLWATVLGVSAVKATIAFAASLALGALRLGAFVLFLPQAIGALATFVGIVGRAAIAIATFNVIGAAQSVGAFTGALIANAAAQARWGASLVASGVAAARDFAVSVGRATAGLIVYAATGTAQALRATQRLMISIATEAIPAFIRLSATILTRTIPAMVAYAIVGMGNIIRNTPKLLVGLAATAVAFAATGKAALAAATQTAIAWAVTAAGAVAGAASAIVAALASVALPLLAIGAAAGLIAIAWANNWGDIQNITSRVLGAVADNVTRFLSWLEGLPFIGGAVGTVRKWVQSTAKVWGEWVPKITKTAGDVIGGIVKEFQSGFPTIQGIIKDFFKIPDIEMPDIQQPLNDAQAPLQELIDDFGDLGRAAASGSDEARAALRALERQVEDTRDIVKGLESALRDAQDAMKAFADPRLIGMQDAEDEIFDLEMQLKRAELAELQMGKAAKDAVKNVEASFDLLAAQQQELAQGIPVTYQRFVWFAEQQKRKAEKDAADAAKAMGKVADEETETERLGRLLKIKQIQKELDFEPFLRQLREHFETLTGANREITFAQAWQGLEEAASQAESLSLQLDQQKAILEAQEIVLEAAKQAYEDQQDAAKALGETVEANTGLENLRLAALSAQTTEMQKQVALSAQLAGVVAQQSSAVAAMGPHSAAFGAGFAGEGTVGRGGIARVGERGVETVLLPAGAQVVAGAGQGATSISNSESSTFNISDAGSPTDVVDAIRRYQSFRRITRGRG